MSKPFSKAKDLKYFAQPLNYTRAQCFSQVIVQKFGGTSLGTVEKLNKVVDIIDKFHKVDSEEQVVAVVSAFSSETKEEGTTTRLLNAAAAAVKGEEFHDFLDRIEDTHMEVINGMLKDDNLRENATSFVQYELGRVRQFCDSLSVIQELSSRSHDLVIGCGERLAAGVLSTVLNQHDIGAEMVDLSNVFPLRQGLDTSKRGYEVVAKHAFEPVLSPIVEKKLVPVVTGFFGNVKGGIIQDIGRGYTDLTSALCAGAIDAKQLQVWKESDGVFTGNPTKIANAQLINLVSPSEAAELTYFGNEVLHPFTMACAIGDDVPIAILNTFKPDGNGTQIIPATEDELQKRVGKYGVAAVCSKNDITTLVMTNEGASEGNSYLARVFAIFERFGVKVDLISTSINKLTVTLNETTSAEQIKEVVHELQKLGDCQVENQRAIVSCIGSGQRHQKGLAAKVFECLAADGVNIEMISQGASEINISVVIDGKDQNKAIHAIHEAFLE
eukprot:augustus_masked-scaffold_134-processed-gene-0.7-mRNA-1 protein AED:0.06 eAED:0.10 QI:0/-1/0/1/-1/1/1/0/498